MAVGPKRPKGPPLNALRAFEAAARLESFVAAAEELGVTPGAVSQHVKAVEAWAGTPLFDRNAQGIALSTAGRRLQGEFTLAFDQLAAATQSLKSLAPNPAIHIAALPSVAQLWLPPRLERLRAARPDLDLSVTALETPPRLSRDLFDLSVFLTIPDGTGDQLVLAEDRIFPVAAPSLAPGLDITTAPLLHDQTWGADWALWSETVSVPIGDATRGARHSLYALAVEEAMAGAGVLMGHEVLVEQALHSGRLVRVSERTCETGKALVLDRPHRSRRHPSLDAVVDLLRTVPAAIRSGS